MSANSSDSSVPESSLEAPSAVMRVAQPWRRALAMAVDTLVFLPLVLAVMGIGARSVKPILILFPLSQVLFVAYQILMHARYGATLGKMLLKIKVVRVDGSSLDMNAALKRYFVDAVLRISLALVSAQILRSPEAAFGPGGMNAFLQSLQKHPAYAALSNISSFWLLAEVIVFTFSRAKRAVHDFIAGTVVVEAKRL